MDEREIRKLLKYLIQSKGHTITQAAEACETSVSHLVTYLNGNGNNIQSSRLIKLLTFLDINLGEILRSNLEISDKNKDSIKELSNSFEVVYESLSDNSKQSVMDLLISKYKRTKKKKNETLRVLKDEREQLVYWRKS